MLRQAPSERPDDRSSVPGVISGVRAARDRPRSSGGRPASAARASRRSPTAGARSGSANRTGSNTRSRRVAASEARSHRSRRRSGTEPDDGGVSGPSLYRVLRPLVVGQQDGDIAVMHVVRVFRRSLLQTFHTLPAAQEILADVANNDTDDPGSISIVKWVARMPEFVLHQSQQGAEDTCLQDVMALFAQVDNGTTNLAIEAKELLKLCSLAAPRKPLNAWRASAYIYAGSGRWSEAAQAAVWESLFQRHGMLDVDLFVEALGEWDVHPQDASSWFHCLEYSLDGLLETSEFGTAVRRGVPGLTLEEVAVRLALEDIRSPAHSGRATVLEELLRCCLAERRWLGVDGLAAPDGDPSDVLVSPDWMQFRLALERIGIHEEDAARLFRKLASSLLHMKTEGAVGTPDVYQDFASLSEGADQRSAEESLRCSGEFYMLHLRCPATRVAGDYAMVLGQLVMGLPVWKKLDADVYLYSAHVSSQLEEPVKPKVAGDYWGIGGRKAKTGNFHSSFFSVCSRRPHRGVMPQEVRGGWEWSNRDVWFQDDAITIHSYNVYPYELFPHIVTSPRGKLVANRSVLVPGEKIVVHYNFSTSLFKSADAECKPFLILVPAEVRWNSSGGHGFEWTGMRGMHARDHYWDADGIQRIVIAVPEHGSTCTGVVEIIVPELQDELRSQVRMSPKHREDMESIQNQALGIAFAESFLQPSMLAGYNMAPQALHSTVDYSLDFEVSLECRLYESKDGLRPSRPDPILPALRFRVSAGAAPPPSPVATLQAEGRRASHIVKLHFTPGTDPVSLREGSFACYRHVAGMGAGAHSAVPEPPLQRFRACVPLRHRQPSWGEVRFLPTVSQWWITHVPRERGEPRYERATRIEVDGTQVSAPMYRSWFEGSGQTWLQAVGLARQSFWEPVYSVWHGWMAGRRQPPVPLYPGSVGLLQHRDPHWEAHVAVACPSAPRLCPRLGELHVEAPSSVPPALPQLPSTVPKWRDMSQLEIKWPETAFCDAMVAVAPEAGQFDQEVLVKPGTSVFIPAPQTGQHVFLRATVREPSNVEGRVRQMFNALDANGDGSLDRDELQTILRAIPGMAPGDVQVLLDAFDADGDGKISVGEFMHWVYKQG